MPGGALADRDVAHRQQHAIVGELHFVRWPPVSAEVAVPGEPAPTGRVHGDAVDVAVGDQRLDGFFGQRRVIRRDRAIELRGEVRGIHVGLGADAGLERGAVEGRVADDAGDGAQDEHQREAAHELGLQRQVGRGVFGACLLMRRRS